VAEVKKKWRKMKSAPKDGTPVLLYCNLYFYSVSNIVVAWYNETYSRPRKEEPYGPFVWVHDDDSRIARDVPTHWMPLPKKPKKLKRKKK